MIKASMFRLSKPKTKYKPIRYKPYNPNPGIKLMVSCSCGLDVTYYVGYKTGMEIQADLLQKHATHQILVEMKRC